MTHEIELVLGAGGVKGYFHIGVLRAIERLKIKVSMLTGVSVGGVIAALWSNGKTSDEILQLFLKSHEKCGNPLLFASAVTMPDPISFVVGWSILSLEKPWKQAVEQLGLKPNDRLRIVAADAETHESVAFEGIDYDLGKALAATGALPTVFLPVRHGDRFLIDGAAAHRNPDRFCKQRAVISQLGFAKTLPREPLDLISLYFHLREVYAPIVQQDTKVDEKKHLLVNHEAPDVCGVSFGLSERRCLEMVEEGDTNFTAAWLESQGS